MLQCNNFLAYSTYPVRGATGKSMADHMSPKFEWLWSVDHPYTKSSRVLYKGFFCPDPSHSILREAFQPNLPLYWFSFYCYFDGRRQHHRALQRRPALPQLLRLRHRQPPQAHPRSLRLSVLNLVGLLKKMALPIERFLLPSIFFFSNLIIHNWFFYLSQIYLQMQKWNCFIFVFLFCWYASGNSYDVNGKIKPLILLKNWFQPWPPC